MHSSWYLAFSQIKVLEALDVGALEIQRSNPSKSQIKKNFKVQGKNIVLNGR
jgi:hypothetical protein